MGYRTKGRTKNRQSVWKIQTEQPFQPQAYPVGYRSEDWNTENGQIKEVSVEF